MVYLFKYFNNLADTKYDKSEDFENEIPDCVSIFGNVNSNQKLLLKKLDVFWG